MEVKVVVRSTSDWAETAVEGLSQLTEEIFQIVFQHF